MNLLLKILGWLLSVVSVLGNGAVISLIIGRPSLRATAAGILLLSLAVADFGVGLIFFPLTFICEEHLCNRNVRIIMIAVFLYASRTNLLAFTLDRYVSITFPLRYTVFITQKRIYYILVASWVIPMVATSLDFIPYVTNIHLDDKRLLTWLIVHTVIINITPALILFLTTIRLMVVLRRLRRQTSAIIAQLSFNKMSCNVTVNRRNREFDYAKVVGVLVALFGILFLMDTLVNICAYADISQCNVSEMDDAVMILQLINSAANPFVYVLLKKNIRNELKRFLTRGSTVAAQVSS